MSWHTNGVLIHADYSRDIPGLLKKLGIEGAEKLDETVSFEDATSSEMESLAVGCVDGWTCLFSSVAIFLIDDDELAKIAKKADVFTLTLEGSSGYPGVDYATSPRLVQDLFHWPDCGLVAERDAARATANDVEFLRGKLKSSRRPSCSTCRVAAGDIRSLSPTRAFR